MQNSKRILVPLLIAIALLAGQSLILEQAHGWEQALPHKDVTIPPGKVLDRSFTLNRDAYLNIVYDIEAGKSLDIYIMTEEQDERASAGHEPTEIGRDFIVKHFGVIGSGSVGKRLQAGRYAIIFRNTSGSSVHLRTHADGE